jgi:hypothetical protein
MHTFQMNALIQFFFQYLTSSACFEPHGFVLRKTAVNAVLYGMFTCLSVTVIPVASYNICHLIKLCVVRDSDSSKDVQGRNLDT